MCQPDPPLSNATIEAALALWQQAGQCHYLPVQGNSMAPLLRNGDLVEVAYQPGPLRRGDVLVFKLGDRVVVYRLLKTQPGDYGQWYLTKGDNLLAADPPVLAANMLGRVLAVRRGPKTLRLDTARGRQAGRLMAWLGLAGLAAITLAQNVTGKSGVARVCGAIARKSQSVLMAIGMLVIGRWKS